MGPEQCSLMDSEAAWDLLASALLPESPMGSARRSLVAPLDLVLGCSAVAGALHRTRPRSGTDALALELVSQLGWERHHLGAVLV